MSSLRALLEERKATEPPPPPRCVETDFRPVSLVTFCPMQAKEWTVPWARLDAISFSDEEESERIELFFPNHQVIVVGEHLRPLMEDIRDFTLRCLRNLPAAHRATLRPRATFISQLEVKLLSDQKARPLPGNPG